MFDREPASIIPPKGAVIGWHVDMSSACVLFGLGISLSILVFLLELIYKRIKDHYSIPTKATLSDGTNKQGRAADAEINQTTIEFSRINNGITSSLDEITQM